MKLFEEIIEDHKKQRILCNMLVDTSGETKKRKVIYEELKNELKVHADAEERYFYRPLFKFDETQDQARHSVAEHQDIDKLIEELDETDMSSPGWLATAKKLKHEVLHHLDEEEEDVFPMADKTLSESKMTDLAKDYRSMMNGR